MPSPQSLHRGFVRLLALTAVALAGVALANQLLQLRAAGAAGMLGVYGILVAVMVITLLSSPAAAALSLALAWRSWDRDGARALGAPVLPGHARGLVESVKAVERLAIEAAETGSRRLAHEALALHPLVSSVDTATAILDEYLARHPDLRALLA